MQVEWDRVGITGVSRVGRIGVAGVHLALRQWRKQSFLVFPSNSSVLVITHVCMAVLYVIHMRIISPSTIYDH